MRQSLYSTPKHKPNPMLLGILGAVLAMLSLTLLWPFLSTLLRFGPLHPDDLTVTLGAGVVLLLLLELLKPIWRARLQA